MTTVYKLYVKNTGDTTLRLLQYLHDELDFIASTNLRLQIIKVANDKKQSEKLEAKGIHRLPAILTDEGAVIEGAQAIRNIFEKNKAAAAAVTTYQQEAPRKGPSAPPPNNFQDDPDLANYYAKVMDPRMQLESEEDGFDAAPKDVLSRRVSEAQTRRGIGRPPIEQPPQTQQQQSHQQQPPAPLPEPNDNVRYATVGEQAPRPPVKITAANADEEFERRLLERGM